MSASHHQAFPPAAPLHSAGRVPNLMSGRRLVFVICGFDLGGAERQAILLARELGSLGAHVEVWGLFPPERGPASSLCDEYGLAWRPLRLDWDRGTLPDLKTALRLASYFRAGKTDIILPYTIYPNVICGAIWRLTGARLCVWNQRDEGLFRMGARLERWAVRQTPLFVSNSNGGAAFLRSTLGVEPARIRTVPNGIQLRPPLADGEAWRTRLELRPATFVATMVANLHRHKDHETLLRAWRLVLDGTPIGERPVLLLAGRRDNSAAAVEALAAELQLAESLRILGHTDDVSGLLEASDLFVFSSVSEGLPNSLLEAMAAGLPVVANDISGIRQAVGEQGRSNLVPVRDPQSFAALILRMIGDPSGRRLAGERNRAYAIECHSVPRMVERTVSALGSALS
jgi:glycosyltransferase involved in cell wall biosynthesis